MSWLQWWFDTKAWLETSCMVFHFPSVAWLQFLCLAKHQLVMRHDWFFGRTCFYPALNGHATKVWGLGFQKPSAAKQKNPKTKTHWSFSFVTMEVRNKQSCCVWKDQRRMKGSPDNLVSVAAFLHYLHVNWNLPSRTCTPLCQIRWMWCIAKTKLSSYLCLPFYNIPNWLSI